MNARTSIVTPTNRMELLGLRQASERCKSIDTAPATRRPGFGFTAKPSLAFRKIYIGPRIVLRPRGMMLALGFDVTLDRAATIVSRDFRRSFPAPDPIPPWVCVREYADYEFPPKPPWMRWKTYNRLDDKAQAHEKAADEILESFIRRFPDAASIFS